MTDVVEWNGHVQVEYALFDLWDEVGLRSGEAEELLGATSRPAEWLKGGRDKVEFASWAAEHYAYVALRASLKRPPPPAEPYERSMTVRASLRSGLVQFWTIASGPATPDVLALPFHGPVMVRAATRGREATQRAAAASMGDPTEVYGIEQWLIDIWSIR